MRWCRAGLAVGFVVFASGCHSAYVDATLTNATSEPVSLVEVDYPSASFGTQSLAPGAVFHYRFKVQGSGNLKLLWTDARRQDHTVNGPSLSEGSEGGLRIEIQPGGTVGWVESFTR
jgi:hypothetical protein